MFWIICTQQEWLWTCGHQNVLTGASFLLTIVGGVLMSPVHFDGLVQERRNSSGLAMKLRLSCINPSNYVRNIGHGLHFFYHPKTSSTRSQNGLFIFCLKCYNFIISRWGLWHHNGTTCSFLFGHILICHQLISVTEISWKIWSYNSIYLYLQCVVMVTWHAAEPPYNMVYYIRQYYLWCDKNMCRI